MLILLAIGLLVIIALRWPSPHRKHASPDLIPVFALSNPDQILISDKPPKLGGKIMSLPRTEFETRENITWSNSPVTYLNTIQHLGINPQKDSRITDGFMDFVICDIHPSVGKGVFATKHIPKDTILGIYTGVLELARGPGGHYALDAKTPDGPRFYYDAIHFRNATSYVQHAPETAASPDIATANVEMKNTIYGGVTLMLYITSRDIEPYEQLLTDYGKGYWKWRKPKWFDTHGKIIENR